MKPITFVRALISIFVYRLPMLNKHTRTNTFCIDKSCRRGSRLHIVKSSETANTSRRSSDNVLAVVGRHKACTNRRNKPPLSHKFNSSWSTNVHSIPVCCFDLAASFAVPVFLIGFVWMESPNGGGIFSFHGHVRFLIIVIN